MACMISQNISQLQHIKIGLLFTYLCTDKPSESPAFFHITNVECESLTSNFNCWHRLLTPSELACPRSPKTIIPSSETLNGTQGLRIRRMGAPVWIPNVLAPSSVSTCTEETFVNPDPFLQLVIPGTRWWWTLPGHKCTVQDKSSVASYLCAQPETVSKQVSQSTCSR